MPSGLEIQKALRALAARWRGYSGSERDEAPFLNELFECYGTDRVAAGARFEDSHASVGIMDLYWPGACIVEMKAPGRAGKLAFDDDYSMGILLSRAHGAWARVRGSTFKADPRYTPTSVFMTFPWPSPAPVAKRDQVAALSVELLARRRSEICGGRAIGLTKLYNDIDEGAHEDMRDTAPAARRGGGRLLRLAEDRRPE